jgi:hypothetical protein
VPTSAPTADGDEHLLPRRDRDRAALHLGAYALGHRAAERRRAVRQDHRELFAADARHRVHRPNAVLQRLGHAFEHEVAGRVTVRVVDLLEVVDVDHQHQGRLAGSRDAVDFAGQRGFELAAVREAGERVAARKFAQRVDHGLQPDRAADGGPIGQFAARLRQQLQRRREPQPGRFVAGVAGVAGIGVGRGVHERPLHGGAMVRSSLAAGPSPIARI